MKKLLSAVSFALCAVFLSTAAFADAALPPGYQVREKLENALLPILIAVVIVVVGVLIKVLKSRKPK